MPIQHAIFFQKRNGVLYQSFLTLLTVLGIIFLFSFAPFALAGNVPSEKLDCSVYESKTSSVTVGLKVGSFFFNVGPDMTFSHRSGVAWDKTVQGTIAKYVELCSRYNAGMVSKEEYETRLHKIEALYQEIQEMETKLFDATRQRAKTAGDELDGILGKKPRKKPTNVGLEIEVEELANRIEKGKNISSPLEPSTPCPLEDILGALGEKEC